MMRLWAQFLTPGASQAAPTVSSVQLLPTPSTAGVTPVASTFAFPAFPASITAGDVYYVQSTQALSLDSYSRGTVLFTLQAASPTAALKLVNAGVLLVLAD